MPCDLSKHDTAEPYTEEETEELRRIFRTMPTFQDDANGGTIQSCDTELYHKTIGDNKRPPEQYVAYKCYWDNNFKGIIPRDEIVEALLAFHDTARLVRERARSCDTSGDGYIDADELGEFFRLCCIHESRLISVSYPEFVEQADTSKDGRVSLEEFGTWVERWLNELYK